MWSKEAPTVSGFYWFYGDPFWLQLPHDEEKGINPFKPGLHMVECKFVRDGFAPLVTSGAFILSSQENLEIFSFEDELRLTQNN